MEEGVIEDGAAGLINPLELALERDSDDPVRFLLGFWLGQVKFRSPAATSITESYTHPGRFTDLSFRPT